ncbi:MAG: prenyltransferase/squalene oxidase repeat-containing protein [Candidatus Saccharibacteria bacterium]
MFRIKGVLWKPGIISLIFLLVIGIMVPPAAAVSTTNDINYSLRKAVDYYYDSGKPLDWMYALGLGAAGDAGAMNYGVGSPDFSKLTDVENRLIGLVAAQKDPAAVSINGEVYNFVNIVSSSQKPDGHFGATGATLNNTIWAVIALDMAAKSGVTGAVYSYDVDKAVEYMVSKQCTDGGFDESGWGEDPDSAAHVLIAIAPHVTSDNQAVSKALIYLRNKQLASGGIDNWGENPSSTAAVIEALVALGQDPQGAGWTKDGHSLISSLLAYQTSNGGFIQNTNWGPVDHTPFALLALADLASGKSKYQNPFVMVPSNIHLSVDSAASLVAGSDADLTVRVSNLSGTNQQVLVIAVLYDSSGKMDRYTYASREIAAGATQSFGLGFGLPPGAGRRVKVMVWDSWQSRQPLCNAVTIPVN